MVRHKRIKGILGFSLSQTGKISVMQSLLCINSSKMKGNLNFALVMYCRDRHLDRAETLTRREHRGWPGLFLQEIDVVLGVVGLWQVGRQSQGSAWSWTEERGCYCLAFL